MKNSELHNKTELVKTVHEVSHGSFLFQIITDESGSTVKFTTVNPPLWGHGFLTKYFTLGNSVTSQIHVRKENLQVYEEIDDALKEIENFVKQ